MFFRKVARTGRKLLNVASVSFFISPRGGGAAGSDAGSGRCNASRKIFLLEGTMRRGQTKIIK